MWLDDSRGHVVDWSTQRWVELTGRRVTLAECPWLEGPAGSPAGIGRDFFDSYTSANALRLERVAGGGLIPVFSILNSNAFNTGRISPAVVHFYQRTSEYELDAWSQWCGAFRPFGWALARIFSRRLQQLNVPLSNLDTSQGMTSRVMPVSSRDGTPVFTAWMRELIGTGNVIYAGAYSTCRVPGFDGRCVRVVFPLPNGNAIVIMRPIAHSDGSLTLVSSGDRFGDPGFYFTVRDANGAMDARYVRSFRETIHVYAPPEGGVRADHVLTIWGLTFLRLHYRLRWRTNT
jgi:hypothetical protein